MKIIELLEKKYEVFKDDNNIFDYETVKDLFTDYFLPYDYVVGDLAYDKIRLKGFYDSKNPKKTSINDFSGVDDYIKKYCAVGCKYFILKKSNN